MVPFIVVIAGSYLLGSIPFGYLIGRIAGIDIRQAGSCNIGATNVVRVLGKRYGYPVFLLDFLKGFGAVKLSMLFATRPPLDWNSPEVFGIIAAVSSVFGHSYSPWLKFKGGKGVATSAGALFALTTVGGLIWLATWIGIFWLTRYVSVASIIAALVLPFACLVISWRNPNTKAIFYFSVCTAALVIWRHRSNLSRLIRGTEPRFIRK
jgi:acyl phosphate:glycerol-3-phosphate acyltransferase